MRLQKGFSFLGFIVWGGLTLFALIFAVKVTPVYVEHQQVKHALRSMKETPDIKVMSTQRVQDKLLRYFQINSIRQVSHKDLQVERTDAGVKLILQYETSKPLFSNIQLLLKFNDEVIIE